MDPSPLGHQPMRSPTGRSWITYNGEIYNFLELKAQLEQLGHVFISESDTEVLLAAYEEWGVQFVTRLNGIWAFALWDTTTQELHLSRDRFGVKPLFLTDRGQGRVAFASEIKAITALDWVRMEPDAGVLKAFLVDGLSDHTSRTSFRGIWHLKAGTVLTLGGSRIREYRYWGPPDLSSDASVQPSRSDARMVDELRELLVDAVTLQLRADVALGSCLSGGIDSSSIVTIASGIRSGTLEPASRRRTDRQAEPQLAFFADFGYPGISERVHVDEVVAHTGIDLVTTSPNAYSAMEALDRVVIAQDEPFGSTSIVAQYFVMQAAHQHGVKVLLDGQGADELLGGYLPYGAIRHAGALRADVVSLRTASRMLMHRRIGLRQTLGYSVLGTRPLPAAWRRIRLGEDILGQAVRGAEAAEAHVERREGTPLANALWRQVASENLPALLRFEDRNSMAFGIEARVPFLDHRVVEHALRMPDRLKIAGLEHKVGLRRAMRGVVPEGVLARRDKIAFSTPQSAWLLATAKTIVGHHRRLSETNGILRKGALDHLATEFLTHRVRDDHLWRALSVELWLRSFA